MTKPTKAQVKQANKERRALMEMYKAGYSDASGHKWNRKVRKECLKDFNLRFLSTMTVEVKEIGTDTRQKTKKGGK